mmetsp:Transcript_20053/g.57489  ORF Transcript_20053/g.57489 Transcript_20053/m.57489 type:complete len:217 (-) Transcript_20053:204-854(-)
MRICTRHRKILPVQQGEHQPRPRLRKNQAERHAAASRVRGTPGAERGAGADAGAGRARHYARERRCHACQYRQDRGARGQVFGPRVAGQIVPKDVARGEEEDVVRQHEDEPAHRLCLHHHRPCNRHSRCHIGRQRGGCGEHSHRQQREQQRVATAAAGRGRGRAAAILPALLGPAAAPQLDRDGRHLLSARARSICCAQLACAPPPLGLGERGRHY